VPDYKPRQVHFALRQSYTVYRWLSDKGKHANANWKEYTDKMVMMWGKEKQWSIVVDDEGATIFGPDGEAVRWEVDE